MPKIYRTMQGEKVDIEALFRKNELTQAVGNMNSNARGDELGPGGVIVKSREQKAREYYLKRKAEKAANKSQAQPSTATPAPPVEEPVEEIKSKKKKIVEKDLEDIDGEIE